MFDRRTKRSTRGSETDAAPSHRRRWAVLVISVVFACACNEAMAPVPDVGVDLRPDVVTAADATVPEDRGAPPSRIGAPCVSDAECGEGVCVTAPLFPGGYCSRPCDRECRTIGTCAQLAEGADCALRCEGDGDCREGYECRDGGCLPRPPGAPDGSPCVSDAACASGTCLTAVPGGYCTRTNCLSDAECRGPDGRATYCMAAYDVTFCAVRCEGDDDCRDGHRCIDGQSVHYPYCFSPDLHIPVPAHFDQAVSTDGACFDRMPESWSFDVPSTGVDSLMINAFSPDGEFVRASAVRNAVARISFDTSLHFGSMGTYGTNVHTIMLPPYPTRATDFAVGNHDIVFDTPVGRGCIDLLFGTPGGGELDLNVISVTPTIPAALAPHHPGLLAAFEGVDRVFAPADVRLGTVRYFDAEPETVERYGIIRNHDELDELALTTAPPTADIEGQRSLNVFVLHGIAEMSAAGLSPILGPGGVHGTDTSALYVDSDWISMSGDGWIHAFTVVLFAHEIGHYLGLFHTSEMIDDGHDPLADTPECDVAPSASCPDRYNLMFPSGGDADEVYITDDQAWVIAKNPLVR